MSELKVHKAYNRWIDEEMPTPNDDLICNEVYLKSEADKVISEFEERIADGDKDFEIANNQNERLLKIVRHQKYKRCLAMAYVEWLKQVIIGLHPESILYRKAFKREHKWKELAEKFKEAK